VSVARLAPPGYRVGQGEPVISVGCSHGAAPTAIRSKIVSVDRFQGPPNLQVAGQPVDGRSGGGLFTDDGLLIGVCNAADAIDRQGLYAALPSIHAELDRANLAFIYKQPTAGALAGKPEPPQRPHTLVDLTSRGNRATPGNASLSPHTVPLSLAVAAGEPANSASPPLSLEEQAALNEIRQRLRDGAEVICVVRPRNDPGAKTEIIVLEKVSPAFFEQLATDVAVTPTKRGMPASATAPGLSRPKPIQWSAPAAAQ
jgi:hypothetical protein